MTKPTPSPGYEDRRNRAAHRYPMLCEGAAKPKRPSVRTMIKNAEKDGKKVSGATLAADGSVSLQFADDVKPNGNGAYETPEDLRKLI
jgi:hypothetical protein